MEISYQIFGSASSEDLDVVFFVKSLGSIAENAAQAKQYASQLTDELGQQKTINPNLAIVSEGKLVAVFKGTVDELNNALFHTFDLHKQAYPKQIMQLLPRDVELKIIRCTRTVLSYFTKTVWREPVKHALSGDIREKIVCLEKLGIISYGDEVNGISRMQFMKTVAFQMGQTLALMDGVECYTKESIAQQYPQLTPYLQRNKNADVVPLHEFWREFVKRISELEPVMQRRKE